MKIKKIIFITLLITVFSIMPAFAGDSNSNASLTIIPAFADGTNSNSSANSEQNQNLNFYNSEYHEAVDLKDGRSFPIPGDVTYPVGPSYFAKPTRTHTLIPVEKIIANMSVWDVASAKNMLNGTINFKCGKNVQVRALVPRDDITPTKRVFVSVEAPTVEYYSKVAFATVAATGSNSISPDVFAKMLVEASKLGANYVQFLAEGVNQNISTWGVGIGLSYTQADLAGTGNGRGSTATGGTGWSYGEAGYKQKPWLQAVFHKVPNLELKPLYKKN